MAKDKKKKKKGGKQFSKQKIHMQLAQNYKPGKELSDAEKERNYQNFRRRAQTKDGHKYRDEGKDPILLRLHFSGTAFNSTQEMLVKVGSFKVLTRDIGDGITEEIGFELQMKSPMTPKRTHRLEVLRKQHKATLYITL